MKDDTAAVAIALALALENTGDSFMKPFGHLCISLQLDVIAEVAIRSAQVTVPLEKSLANAQFSSLWHLQRQVLRTSQIC